MPYKHILAPTDGSGRSRKAVKAAVGLARAVGARITGLYVVPEGVPTYFSGNKVYGSGVLGREYKALAKRHADSVLAQVARAAGTAGVPCETRQQLAPDAWRIIVDTARSRGCDLIVMGSHGRGGVAGLVLGSQTTKVLAHSKIPVLVCR